MKTKFLTILAGILLCTGLAVAQGQFNGGGGGGGGTVKGATGTANQIDVTNSTTDPVVSLDGTIIFPGTASGKVINGISYSQNYTGATLDVRLNACIVDAETGANGNTSHICDARGESGTQTISATILVGDSSSDKVTVIIPPSCDWQITNSANFTGTQSAIYQYTNSYFGNPTEPQFGCEIENDTTTNDLYALYISDSVVNGQFTAEGFYLRNAGEGLAGPAAMMIQYGVDTSRWSNIQVFQYYASNYAIQIGVTGSHSPCCSSHMDGIQAYGNNVGGTILNIVSPSSGGWPNAFWINNSSFGHPKSGVPVILCTNSSGSNLAMPIVGFNGGYVETNNGDTTTQIAESNGCNITVNEMAVKNEGGSTSTAPFWKIDNAQNSFTATDLAMPYEFTFPATAVSNLYTGETIKTDGNGNLPSYRAGQDYATNYNGNYFNFNEVGTALSGAAGQDLCRGNSSTHAIDCNFNNGGEAALATTATPIIAPCSAGLYYAGAAITAGTYTLSAYCYNVFGATYTITGISAWSNNSGTSTCNVADNNSNALLTGAITASPSWVAGTQSGTTTIAGGGWVNFTIVADGTSTRINCVMTTSRPL